MRVLEAGAGSGALSCSLLRAVGEHGTLTSYERREDFADVARGNVGAFFGEVPANWSLRLGDLDQHPADGGRGPRRPGHARAVGGAADGRRGAAARRGAGRLRGDDDAAVRRTSRRCALRAVWTEPHAWETLLRAWHAEGLAVRPEHRMVAHTAFLVTARRLAQGAVAPMRQRRKRLAERSRVPVT